MLRISSGPHGIIIRECHGNRWDRTALLEIARFVISSVPWVECMWEAARVMLYTDVRWGGYLVGTLPKWPAQPNLAQTSRSHPQNLYTPLLCQILVSRSEAILNLHPGLRDFCDLRWYHPRNSYRSLKYHIYETVKLNQIEKWKLIDYSESEKRYKAFIEHDTVWALIVQSYFLWHSATAW